MLKPVRMVTSKPARQTYLNTLLLTTTSAILLLIAAFAYLVFYFNFIPQIGLTRDVHLQFGHGPYPYAFVSLGKTITCQQPYAIDLSLILPRSPVNIAAGNFMLSLSFLSPEHKPYVFEYPQADADVPSHFLDIPSIPRDQIIFTARRQALLAYQPPIVSFTKQLFHIPLYVMGFRSREAETLHVNMAKSVTFSKGWRNIPDGVYIEIQTPALKHTPTMSVVSTVSGATEIQIYECKMHLRAKLEGLRWIMYHYKTTSFLAFTSAFWLAEVLFTILTWALLNMRSSSQTSGIMTGILKPEGETGHDIRVKVEDLGEEEEEEDADLSDTPRTFPTYARQIPLSYHGSRPPSDVLIKTEGVADEIKREPGEADDETEEIVDVRRDREGGRSDSGLGTSFSEDGGSNKTSSVRRQGRRG